MTHDIDDYTITVTRLDAVTWVWTVRDPNGVFVYNGAATSRRFALWCARRAVERTQNPKVLRSEQLTYGDAKRRNR